MKIDIDDINYIFSHEELNLAFRKEKYTDKISDLLRNWKFILTKGIKSICHLFIPQYRALKPHDILFLYSSNNNYRTLKPIQEEMPNSLIVNEASLPLRRTWFYAMLYSPIVIYKYIVSSGYIKKAYTSEFAYYCHAYGYYIEAIHILKRIKPQILVVANDHYYSQRSFFRAAQKLNIKTAYAQHSSVSENFPPLEFDYAFLDGQESLDKYKANNKICTSTIFLSGSPRFDIITKLEEKLINKIAPLRIGIAINKNDLPSKIELLIKTLQEQIKNVIISFRPHPLMRNSFWKDLAKQYNCIFSDPSTENPFEFINNNDILIAGESSFHLDVALCKKRSFLCNLTNDNILDYYGYLKNGLISQLPENYSTLNDVSLKEESSERTKLIQFYVSNYKTSDWGKSAKFIANKLQKLI